MLLSRIIIILLIVLAVPKLDGAQLYFPADDDTWEIMPIQETGWDTSYVQQLYDYLDEQNSKAFIVLKDGRIVLEKYFDGFVRDSNWYWASAGKTLTAAMVGIAMDEGYLDLSDKTSKYLGSPWTSLTLQQEDAITIRHQLTMTTGLDDGVEDSYCTAPECLQYKEDAGGRWAYHNAPYTLLDTVVSRATGMDYRLYFTSRLRNKIGMNGKWLKTVYHNLYISTALSMARFGLLMQAGGDWAGETVIADKEYLNDMITQSQQLNKSYGYLWWLNGYESFMVPALQYVFSGMMFPDAPADLYSALGKNGQCLSISPSLGVVVVRMGDPPAGEDGFIAYNLNNKIWENIMLIIGGSLVSEEKNGGSDYIYPNPATDYITIEINAEDSMLLNKDDKMLIYDYMGRSVSVNINGTVTDSSISFRIDLATIGPGLYFFRYGSHSGAFSVAGH